MGNPHANHGMKLTAPDHHLRLLTSHVCPHYTAPTHAAQKTILPSCCVFTHCCRNSLTVPLPSNGHLYSFHYSGFQLCGHNIIDNLNAVHELDIKSVFIVPDCGDHARCHSVLETCHELNILLHSPI